MRMSEVKVERNYSPNLLNWNEFEHLINIRPLMTKKRVKFFNSEDYRWTATNWVHDPNTYPSSIMSEDNDNDNDQADGNTKLATKPKTKIPSLYRVLMMNDDYTPMEFVIEVLEKFFQKNREEATQIMLHVHQRGVGVCGIYTYDLAETKAMQVMNYARKYEHPLQVQLEKE